MTFLAGIALGIEGWLDFWNSGNPPFPRLHHIVNTLISAIYLKTILTSQSLPVRLWNIFSYMQATSYFTIGLGGILKGGWDGFLMFGFTGFKITTERDGNNFPIKGLYVGFTDFIDMYLYKK